MKAFSFLIAVGLSCMAFSVSCSVASSPTEGTHARKKNPAQPVPVPDYALLRRLEQGQTTLQEARKLLGAPTAITVDGQRTEWFYRQDKARVRIQFDAQQRVSAYAYQSGSSDASRLDAQRVKAIRVGVSETDLVQQFGPPTYASLSASGKEIAYENLANHARLRVLLTGKADAVVANYLFSETSESSAPLNLDQLIQIESGKTTLTDVASKLGSPSQKLIDKDKERWYYQSGTSKLLLDFNRGQAETVASYVYDSK